MRNLWVSSHLSSHALFPLSKGKTPAFWWVLVQGHSPDKASPLWGPTPGRALGGI